MQVQQVLHYAGYSNGGTAYAPAQSQPKTVSLKSDGSGQAGAAWLPSDLGFKSGWQPGTTKGSSPDYWVETVSYSPTAPTGGQYGSDVSGLFTGASIDSQGVLYDAAKLVDTYVPAIGLTVKSTATTASGAKVESFGKNDGKGGFPTSEKTLAAPVTYQPDTKPADLPAYLGVEAEGFDPLRTAAVDPGLKDGYYTVNVMFTVTADSGSILNTGVEALNGSHSVTNTVQRLDPTKDVVVNVGTPTSPGGTSTTTPHRVTVSPVIAPAPWAVAPIMC